MKFIVANTPGMDSLRASIEVAKAQAVEQYHQTIEVLAGDEGVQNFAAVDAQAASAAEGVISQYQQFVRNVPLPKRIIVRGDNVTEESFHAALERATSEPERQRIIQDLAQWLKEQDLRSQGTQ